VQSQNILSLTIFHTEQFLKQAEVLIVHRSDSYLYSIIGQIRGKLALIKLPAGNSFELTTKGHKKEIDDAEISMALLGEEPEVPVVLAGDEVAA